MSGSEEWRHISDRKDRKRIQNRLSQRNVRKKKKETCQDSGTTVCQLAQAEDPQPAPLFNWVDHDVAFRSLETDMGQPQQDQRQEDNSLIGPLDSHLEDLFPHTGSRESWNDMEALSMPWQLPGQSGRSDEPTCINEGCMGSATSGLSLTCLPNSTTGSGFASGYSNQAIPLNPRKATGSNRSCTCSPSSQRQITTSCQSISLSNTVNNRLLSRPTDFTPISVTQQQHQCVASPPTPHFRNTWIEHGVKSKEAVVADVLEILSKYGMNISDVVESITASPESHGEYLPSPRRDSSDLQSVRHIVPDGPTGRQLAQILTEYQEENLEKVIIMQFKNRRPSDGRI